MGQVFTLDQVETAKRALKKVLPNFDVQDVKLETSESDNDTMVLSNYTFTWIAEGILIEAFIAAPYRYDEPPDGDNVEIAVVKNFYDALAEIAAVEARQDMHNTIMDLFNPDDSCCAEPQ